ncbi:hypothetical protein Taro_032974 [Colocasia esculenta]|uniref:RING-type domain-containing protein n=1 Tax=Colocasia esculenta TaxID=4460 RepID=A0A843VWG4_COLES|nr:hypothetical protein [Colocasia esculenta]
MRPPRQLLWVPLSGSNDTAATHGSTSSGSNNASSNPWGPFGNAATYGTDMAIVVGILLSGFLLGILLMIGVRYCLRRRRGARDPAAAAAAAGDADQKPSRGGGGAGEEHPSEPPTLYTPGETQMAGAAAECAICLTEFSEGDALRVLPACRHGFHVECVERWLASAAGSSRHPSRKAPAPSCPVCRSRCLPPEREPEPEPAPAPEP